MAKQPNLSKKRDEKETNTISSELELANFPSNQWKGWCDLSCHKVADYNKSEKAHPNMAIFLYGF